MSNSLFNKSQSGAYVKNGHVLSGYASKVSIGFILFYYLQTSRTYSPQRYMILKYDI